MKLPLRFVAPLLVLLTGAATLGAQSGDAASQTPGKPDSLGGMLSAAPDTVTSTAPGSQVRIVRLSQVRGQVQIDRNIERGFETAFLNLPITQQVRLKTDEGVAEVEFEDNSTLRLTTHTTVEFPLLRLSPTGGTLSSVRVLQGMVYVSLASTKGNEFKVSFGDRNVVLAPSAHIELAVASPSTRLGVLDGSVQIQDSTGASNSTLGKKHSLLFDSASPSAPVMLSKIEKTEFDGWDKNAADYHKQYANASAFGASSASYGISDLNYYGSFTSLPGCGSVWRPHFASAAWDPYSNGSWAWYASAGYSWVSPYQWGWTPFHTGSWQLCDSGGWGWHPGGSWQGLMNAESALRTARGIGKRPIGPPSPGRPTVVAVNTRPLAVSQLTTSETFVFNKDSAGLGVPRQTFGKLNGIASSVEHHGNFAAPVVSSYGVVIARSAGGAGGQESMAANHHSNGVSSSMASSSQQVGRASGMSSAGASHSGSTGGGGVGGGHH